MNFPGENLVIALWKTLTEHGIGSLLRPWQIKRDGAAHTHVRAQEILTLAQAEKYAEDIRAGRLQVDPKGVLHQLPAPSASDGNLLPPEQLPNVTHSIEEAVTRRVISDSVRKEVNVARAVMHAERQLSEDQQEPPEDTIALDWLFRWRDYAGEVSSETLQSLWGSVLAGELKSPGAFSLRTLDFMRNLSKSDADDITKLASWVLAGRIFRPDQGMEAAGVSFEFLVRMEDLGIVTGAQNELMMAEWRITDQQALIRGHKRALIVRHTDPNKTFSLRACALTRVGSELMRLGSFEDNLPYIRRVGEKIKALGFTVQLAEYSRATASHVRVFNKEQL